MLPKVNDDLIIDFKIKEIPSNTYKLYINSNTITGLVDGIEAVKQAVYLMLNIERYRHIIYSWNYGIELCDLIGKPSYFVISELERIISEALMQDNRIKGVSDFAFKTEKGKVYADFTVNTIYGKFKTSKEVDI